MFVTVVRHKPMKMAKKVDDFSAAHCPKYGVWGNIKGRPPVNGVRRGPCNLGIQGPCPHNLVGSQDISLAVKPDIVGVAGANMQWGHFVCPSCSQKRENTAFELVIQSVWETLSPSKQVGRSSTPCRKRNQVWGRENERWPKYMQQRGQCWKLEEFSKTSLAL